MFILNPHSGVPIYQQLIDRRCGGWWRAASCAPGTELPSVREMAQEHTVHPMTISKALQPAGGRGAVLERRRGKPMAVAAMKKSHSSRARAPGSRLEPQLEQLALSMRQLELGERDVVDLLKKKLGEGQ